MISEIAAIKEAFEGEHMTPEQIAENRGLDLVAVKTALMQCSPVYRKLCGKEPEEEDALNFTNEQLMRVNDVIYELAIGAEDPHLRGKMAIYVRDDKKGRKEVVKNVGNNTFNVLQINERLAQVKQLASAATLELSHG